MISWRTILSVFSCTILYAIFVWEASRPEAKPVLSPPVAQYQSKVGQNGISLNSFGGALPPFTADHPLLTVRGIGKRDVCNATWPGRYQQTCQPSRTLCCIVPGAKLPGCNAILDWGACCTESGDCYVDVSSNCLSGSSQCGNGICCPAQTSCIRNFNYTTGRLARCSVNQSLLPGFSSSSSSATTAPTRTATSTVSNPTTTGTSAPTTAPPTSSPSGNPSDGGLTAGAAAGISVGSIAVAGLLGIAVFMLWRRRRRDKKEESPGATPLQSQYTPQHTPSHYTTQHSPYTPQHSPYTPHSGTAQHYPPQEMANETQLHEAPNDEGYYVDQYGRQIPYKLSYAHSGVSPIREMR